MSETAPRPTASGARGFVLPNQRRLLEGSAGNRLTPFLHILYTPDPPAAENCAVTRARSADARGLLSVVDFPSFRSLRPLPRLGHSKRTLLCGPHQACPIPPPLGVPCGLPVARLFAGSHSPTHLSVPPTRCCPAVRPCGSLCFGPCAPVSAACLCPLGSRQIRLRNGAAAPLSSGRTPPFAFSLAVFSVLPSLPRFSKPSGAGLLCQRLGPAPQPAAAS